MKFLVPILMVVSGFVLVSCGVGGVSSVVPSSKIASTVPLSMTTQKENPVATQQDILDQYPLANVYQGVGSTD